MTDTESRLQTLESREAIREVLARASRGLDRLDLDLLKSAFWEDAVDDRGVVRGNAHAMAPDLIEFARTRYVSSQHIICNCSIELAGKQAASETYVVAWHRLRADDDTLDTLFGAEAVQTFQKKHNGPPDQFVVGARYLDHHEQRGSEWRILSRANALAWCDIRTSTDWPTTGAIAGSNSFERRDKSDRVYQLLMR